MKFCLYVLIPFSLFYVVLRVCKGLKAKNVPLLGKRFSNFHREQLFLICFTVTIKTRSTTDKDWRVVSAVVSGGLFVILVASVVIWRNKFSQLHEYIALKQEPPKE